MANLIFILGGARSGKSTFAEKIASKSGQSVTYIATAQAGDDEMELRINKHRERRPSSWETREIQMNVAKTLQKDPVDTEMILLDCLSLLISNVLLDSAGYNENPDEATVLEAMSKEVRELEEYIRESKKNWIVVSNDVGAGVVPPYYLGRYYRDGIGKANQILASIADESYYLIAGYAIPLHEIGINIQNMK